MATCWSCNQRPHARMVEMADRHVTPGGAYMRVKTPLCQKCLSHKTWLDIFGFLGVFMMVGAMAALFAGFSGLVEQPLATLAIVAGILLVVSFVASQILHNRFYKKVQARIRQEISQV